MREDQDRPDPTDWWTQNAPQTAAMRTDPVTDPHDPRLSDPAYASDPEVLKFLNSIYGPTGTAMNKPTPTSTWDPNQQAWNQEKTKDPGPGPTQGPSGNIGVPTSGFGSAPTPYASDANAPTYNPMPTYVAPTWTGGDYQNPTLEDLQAMPGYQAQLAAGLQARNRSAAAAGTVLNGGTVKGLERYAIDQTNNSYQDLRNNTFEAYKQRYSQFTDAAGLDLAARTANANENQNTFQNRMNTFQTGNARTLSDYLTNLTAKRNSELDYWSRLQDLNQTGSNLAGNSR